MIVVRDKSLDNKVRCDNFINVITDDTAIAILKHDDQHYTARLNLSNIKTGLTKQDNQFYYFEHDIINKLTTNNDKGFNMQGDMH